MSKLFNMTITKTQIIEAIQAIPKEEFTDIDEVINEIILLEKIQRGLKDVEEGRVLSEEELDKLMEQW